MIRSAVKINAAKLREYLDIMHGEADARDLRSEAIRRIVKSARDDGYDGKAVRKIFARERMDSEARQRDDDILAVYEQALGGKGRALAAIAEGVPVGEAAKANGVHRATVARVRHVAKQPSNATPHDTETGEVTGGVDAASTPLPSSAPVAASEKEDLGVAAGAGPFDAQETTKSCGGVESRHADTSEGAIGLRKAAQQEMAVSNAAGDHRHAATHESAEGRCNASAAQAVNVGGQDVTAPSAGVATGPQDTSPPIAVGVETRPKGTSIPAAGDDLVIPAFLRRTA